MYSWAEEVGTRRAEILSLRKKDLPNQTDVMRDRDGHVKWPIKVVRKGGATWTVLAPTDLVLATWDWIFLGRADMVARCRRSILGYQEPQEIFISSRTGMPLDKDSLTALAKRDFAVANVEKASLHRLRAKFCVELIQTLVESLFEGGIKVGTTSSWVETILTIAAERMGHISPMSLRPYLNQVLDRKILETEASKAQSVKSCIRVLHHRREILRRTVNLNLHLRNIAESIERGQRKRAAKLIRQLQLEVDDYADC
jgi:integrase